MKGLAESLRATGPAINSILASSGTAGAAVGILHHGEVVHTAGYGFRDIDRRLPMDRRSVVSLFLLTKFITAAALESALDANGASLDSTLVSLVPSAITTQPCSRKPRSATSYHTGSAWTSSGYGYPNPNPDRLISTRPRRSPLRPDSVRSSSRTTGITLWQPSRPSHSPTSPPASIWLGTSLSPSA